MNFIVKSNYIQLHYDRKFNSVGVCVCRVVYASLTRNGLDYFGLVQVISTSSGTLCCVAACIFAYMYPHSFL